MTIQWPTDEHRITIIDEIRAAIGRPITINITISGIPCSVSGCNLDPTTGLSTNQFCPTCQGAYYINTVSGVTVTGYISWGMFDRPLWQRGGPIVEGDCIVQIKYTVANVGYVNNVDSFVVDGKTMNKKSVDYRGVPTINRILITMKQEE